MSANNFIKIKKSNDKWLVTERDADTGSTNTLIGWALTLEDAAKMANIYMKENEVEYGLSIEEDLI